MEKAGANKRKSLIAASLVGLMAVTGVSIVGTANAHAGDGEKCYGINACKGTGECGGKGYSCAGNNSCEGKGWLTVPQGTCTKIKGGSLQAAE